MAAACGVHKLVADITIRADDRVLFVKYKDASRYDGQRGWFLPDDYLGHLEHPDEAAKRIATTQASLANVVPKLSHIESFEDGAWHLIFHYRVDLEGKPRVRAGENIAAMEWLDLRRLPPPSAIAHHGWARSTIARLRKSSP